jgi:hypothetical protein
MGISNVSSNSTSTTSSNLSQSELLASIYSTPNLINILSNSDSSDSSSAISDILDLSSEAQTAADELSGSSDDSLMSLLSSSYGSVVYDSLQASADGEFEDLQSTLTELFEANGIDTSKEIQLQLNDDGEVVVANDNPQKDEIEALFANDSSLTEAFSTFVSYSKLAATGTEMQAFQTLYAVNETIALSAYSYLFDGSSTGTMTLSISGDTYQSLYQRTGQDAIVVSTNAE